jgi:NAD dependent epimerase/dehydratase family enzyme
LLKIGAFIIRTEPELVLKSRWVLPEKLQKSGFKWKFAKFNDAVQGLVETTR